MGPWLTVNKFHIKNSHWKGYCFFRVDWHARYINHWHDFFITGRGPSPVSTVTWHWIFYTFQYVAIESGITRHHMLENRTCFAEGRFWLMLTMNATAAEVPTQNDGISCNRIPMSCIKWMERARYNILENTLLLLRKF